MPEITKADANSIKRILKAHEDQADAQMPVGKKRKGIAPSMFYDEYIKTGNPMFKDAAHSAFKSLLNG